MKYVYLDIGAFTGDSIEKFLLRKGLTIPPEEFEIYAFEPNPNCFPALSRLFERLPNFIQIETAAAWVKDEIREFAIDNTKTPWGSTLMPSKQDYATFDKVEIHCIDFSEWIKQFKDDYVIVKMDIEGAEFKILPHMLNQGTYKIMNQLWLETHPNKVKDYTTTASDALFKKLRQDIIVEEWS